MTSGNVCSICMDPVRPARGYRIGGLYSSTTMLCDACAEELGRRMGLLIPLRPSDEEGGA